ncbi:hypothetical protein BJF79_30295 [Actinomadura sp. CNU-125]|nr:hypothetical protein BJF79_30295 [Actinomadura sp. CNU-125]
MTDTVALLGRLYFEGDHAPDFLLATPDLTDLDAALDAIASTPRTALKAQMNELFVLRGRRSVPLSRELADGDVETLERLGSVLRRYYDIAVAPYTEHAQRAHTAERSRQGEVALSAGVDAWLGGYPPELMHWEYGVLAVGSPHEADFRLEGRPMTLIPSFFATNIRATGEHWIPPIIAYPVEHRLGWLADGPPERPRPSASLDRLIGSARSAALETLDRAMTTTQLADALALSLPTISRHTAILREAGLITTRRQGQAVLHTRTALGEALLSGSHPPITPTPAPAVSTDHHGPREGLDA